MEKLPETSDNKAAGMLARFQSFTQTKVYPNIAPWYYVAFVIYVVYVVGSPIISHVVVPYFSLVLALSTFVWIGIWCRWWFSSRHVFEDWYNLYLLGVNIVTHVFAAAIAFRSDESYSHLVGATYVVGAIAWAVLVMLVAYQRDAYFRKQNAELREIIREIFTIEMSHSDSIKTLAGSIRQLLEMIRTIQENSTLTKTVQSLEMQVGEMKRATDLQLGVDKSLGDADH